MATVPRRKSYMGGGCPGFLGCGNARRWWGAAGRAGAVSTPKERAEQKRREKLELIREQLDNGELTIRQMTPAERKRHPPRPPGPKRRRRW